MGDQHRLDLGSALSALRMASGSAALPHSKLERDDIGAELLGDVGEAVAEDADGHRQHLVARGQGIDHGGLQAAGTGAGEQEDVILGLEELLQLGGDVVLNLPELGAAMVYHLAAIALSTSSGRGVGPGIRRLSIFLLFSSLY